jgi:hypothetical protein
MCFLKNDQTKVLVLEQDMFVWKVTNGGSICKECFVSISEHFPYITYNTYKKGWLSKLLARFSTQLEGEVFHSYYIAGGTEWKIYARNRAYEGMALFQIPKGTKIYVDLEYGEIASFAIRYLEPLTENNKHFITNQVLPF